MNILLVRNGRHIEGDEERGYPGSWEYEGWEWKSLLRLNLHLQIHKNRKQLNTLAVFFHHSLNLPKVKTATNVEKILLQKSYGAMIKSTKAYANSLRNIYRTRDNYGY